MKACFILLALAVLCLSVQARPKEKRSAYGGGYGGGYGSGSGSGLSHIEVVRPMVAPVHHVHLGGSNYGSAPVRTYSAPVAAPVQMDIAPVRTYSAPVAAPVQMDIAPVRTYSAPVNTYSAPIAAPAMDIAPVQVQSSYGSKVSQDTTVEIHTPVAIEELDPSLRNMCAERKNGVVFYLPHPTKQWFYIQCDQYGHAFLKECPAGTIFTQNLVCENINDLHAISQSIETKPVLDQTVGSYGAAPVFAADQTNVIETTHVDTFSPAPEFNGMCLNSHIFYFRHPTEQTWYIQCDEFGKAFVRQCPSGLIFTANLVCENPLNLLTVSTSVAAPALDHYAAVAPAYSTAPVSTYGSTVSQDVTTVEIHTPVAIEELDPSLRNMCAERKNGVVFYLPHPTKQSFYIQCDQYGHAFLKECPAGTIFTQNLVCENINDLHTITQSIETKPLFDQTVGSYGAAPVFAADQTNIVSTAVNTFTEAPEFNGMCSNSHTFFFRHPTERTWYIQCDEFGKAFVGQCPSGLVFTSNLVCENPLNLIQVSTVVSPSFDNYAAVAPSVAPVAPVQSFDNYAPVAASIAPSFDNTAAVAPSYSAPSYSKVIETRPVVSQDTTYGQKIPVMTLHKPMY